MTIGQEAGTPIEQIEPQEPSKPLTHVDRVRDRLRTAKDLDPLRRKTYNIRRLVAGDLSVLGGSMPSQQEEVPVGESMKELYDFIVTDFQEGRSNKMMRVLRTLVHQVSFKLPDIEFEGLEPIESAVNGGYCKITMGPDPKGCSANDEMQMALLDYLMGGLGWMKACWKEGRPALMFCDSLDMSWDRTAKIPTRHRWRSCRFRESLYVWMEMFPNADWSSHLQASESGREMDKVVELEFYYDLDGGQFGSHYVFEVGADESFGDEPIEVDDNPYFFMVQDKRIPYLPYEVMYFWLMPSLRSPIGLAEQVIPNQIASWEAETSIRLTSKRGGRFYQAPKGALSETERKKFDSGEIGSLVELENGAITEGPSLEVQKTLMEWFMYNDREIIGHGGANPYASGSAQDVTYAREVDEISSQSGLTASVIAKDYAALWVRCARKFLGVAAAYDDRDMTIRVEQEELVFNQSNPIRQYLYPDADMVIREDTMQFRDPKEMQQKALSDLEIALNPEIYSRFPNAPQLAYEAYKRAMGEQNVQPWLEQPQTGMQMPMDPAMEATASTAA